MFTMRARSVAARAKECRAEGKVKDAECFKDTLEPSIHRELLIISINGLMHLSRAVRIAQGLVSLTLPAFPGRFPATAPRPALPVPSRQARRNGERDDAITI